MRNDSVMPWRLTPDEIERANPPAKDHAVCLWPDYLVIVGRNETGQGVFLAGLGRASPHGRPGRPVPSCQDFWVTAPAAHARACLTRSSHPATVEADLGAQRSRRPGMPGVRPDDSHLVPPAAGPCPSSHRSLARPRAAAADRAHGVRILRDGSPDGPRGRLGRRSDGDGRGWPVWHLRRREALPRGARATAGR